MQPRIQRVFNSPDASVSKVCANQYGRAGKCDQDPASRRILKCDLLIAQELADGARWKNQRLMPVVTASVPAVVPTVPPRAEELLKSASKPSPVKPSVPRSVMFGARKPRL